MSRLRAVGLYHNLNFKDGQQELQTPFEPLPLVEQATHIPIEVPEIFIKPYIENLTQNYDMQNTWPVTQPDESKLSLYNASPEDIPQLEQKLISLSELTPKNQTTKDDIFCNNIIHHIHCKSNENYFIDTMGILHKSITDFNIIFLSVVVPKILIKYLLHAAHDSLGYVGATKLYYLLKRLYYFQGMEKAINWYVRTCQKCLIINLQKPNYINLHEDIAQTPQDHISIKLIGPYNTTPQGN